jgi:DNA-binding XRE family transcriptional regulator
MTKKRKPTTDAVEILHRRYYEGRPERLAALEEERANDEIARKLYELRTQAGLTQRQLARRVGTTASVICRLEDADYEGHSLAMLRRIAAALGKRVEIRFMPIQAKAAPARQRTRKRNDALV